MWKDEQHQWNIFFTLLFLGVVGGSYAILARYHAIPSSIPLGDAVLLALASFRLTRLFLNDVITQWVRDLFFDVTEGEGGELVRSKPLRGPRRTLATLFACPWCFGLWAATLLTIFYFATPHAWFFLLILALAGAATLLQLLANLIGWHAEGKKMEVESRAH